MSFGPVQYVLPGFEPPWFSDPHVLYRQLFEHYPWHLFAPLREHYERVLPRYMGNRSTDNESTAAETPPIPTLGDYLAGVDDCSETHTESRPGPGGRPGVPFDALLKAFLGARVQQNEDTDRAVFHLLHDNPVFCYCCGFSKPPSYRVVARFDQIMTQEGLWEKFFHIVRDFSLECGAARLTEEVAIDTTHMEGDAQLNKKKKDSEELTDDNIGIVRKSAAVTYIGHKLALISDTTYHLPWAAVAFPGGTVDNKTLRDSLESYFAISPDAWMNISRVLADGIYDDAGNHTLVVELTLGGAILITPINPRRRKDKTSDASGIRLIDRYGVPHCIAGLKMHFAGRDIHREQYIWACPRMGVHVAEPQPCPLQYKCCPGAAAGRVFRVDRAETPQINWGCPQHSQRYKDIYSRRASIEGVFGWLKDRLGMRRVHRRGHAAAQALAAQCAGLMHMFHQMRYWGLFQWPTTAPKAA